MKYRGKCSAEFSADTNVFFLIMINNKKINIHTFRLTFYFDRGKMA